MVVVPERAASLMEICSTQGWRSSGFAPVGVAVVSSSGRLALVFLGSRRGAGLLVEGSG